jgi:hypothetical protein
VTYELPATSIKLPGAVRYDCPVGPCDFTFNLPLSDEQFGSTITMRLWGENSAEMQEGADLMQEHIAAHTPEQFATALWTNDERWEEVIGSVNEKISALDRSAARGWASVTHSQESLQEARDTLRTAQGDLSQCQALLGRVKGLLEVAVLTGAEANIVQAARQAVEVLGEPGEHRHYLSTSCVHGDHAYCQGDTGAAGAKTAARCKFCPSKCVCPCHLPQIVLERCPDCNVLLGANHQWGCDRAVCPVSGLARLHCPQTRHACPEDRWEGKEGHDAQQAEMAEDLVRSNPGESTAEADPYGA